MPSSLDGVSVYVATPVDRPIHLATMVSYLDTQEAALKYGVKIDFGFVTCSLVHHGRTLLGNVFLSRPEFTHIFWIDSDIVWKPTDFMRALLHTKKHECVVGIYPRRADPPGYFVKFPEPKPEPDEDGLVEIEGTGLGFACIRREVMERVAERQPKLKYFNAKEPSARLFRCDDHDGEARGEDYAFWADVRDAGFRIYADTQADLGHVGTKIYRSNVTGAAL